MRNFDFQGNWFDVFISVLKKLRECAVLCLFIM